MRVYCCECRESVELSDFTSTEADDLTPVLARYGWIVSVTGSDPDNVVLRPLCDACAVTVYGRETVESALKLMRPPEAVS